MNKLLTVVKRDVFVCYNFGNYSSSQDVSSICCEEFIKMNILGSIPSHMDYDGQRKAEQLYRVIITLFGVVGLIWGYIIEQFSQTVYILGAGFLLAGLVTIPPWPMYRRKALAWQKPRAEGDAAEQSSKSKKKK